jgi:5-methylcytosine-specific restriction protein A
MPSKIPSHRPFGAPDPARVRRDYDRTARDRELLKLYSSARWKKFRELIKAERVLCADCQAEGQTTVGQHCHHLVDPRDNPDLAFDETNIVLLCLSHHNSRHGKHGRR